MTRRRPLPGRRATQWAALVLLALTLFTLAGPLLWRVDPGLIDIRARSLPMSAAHPMGTDHLGRDLLARLMAGGRITLAVGFAAMVLAIGFGTAVGMLAGYFRRFDTLLMRMTDLFLALPLLPLLLLLVMLFRDPLARVFGPEAGTFLLIVTAIGGISWMPTARVIRGEVLAIKQREFIIAARMVGAGPGRILLRHILPAVLSPLVVSAALGVAGAVTTESALSFLGLGFPPDFPTWGRLLQDGMPYITLAPGRVLWPAALLALLVLAVNQLGEGLRLAFDPDRQQPV